MAIAINILTSGNALNAANPASASITPGSDRLVLVAVNYIFEGGGTTAITISGNGLTWDVVQSHVVAGHRQMVFRGMGASPSTGAITFTGTTFDSIVWSVAEFSGVDTSGTNGSGAIAQSKVATGTSTTPTVTLDTAIGSGGATYGAVSNASDTTVTPGASYTEIHDLNAGGSGESASLLETEYRLAGNVVINATISSAAWGVIGIEIKTEPLAILPSGIATAEAFGTAVVGRGAVAIVPAGIATLEAFGNAEVNLVLKIITPSGIATLEAFGTATVARVVYIVPAGIASEEAFGAPVVVGLAGTFTQGAQPKQILFHIYTSAGVAIRAWPDVASWPRYSWPINSGPGTFDVKLPRAWGAAGEPGEVGSLDDIRHGNIVKVYIVDRESGDHGQLIWQGTIQHYTADLKGQLFDLRLLPYTSRLESDRTIIEPLTFTDTDPTQMIKYFVDNGYLPGITWDASSPDVGLDFSLTLEKIKVGQAIKLIRGLAGGRWYTRLNPDNSLTFDAWGPKAADHTLIVGKHVSADVLFERSSLEVRKRSLVTGDGVQAVATEPGYDPETEPLDDFYANVRITDGLTAQRIAGARLEALIQPTIGTRFTVIDSNLDAEIGYDLESLKPGQTVRLIVPDRAFGFWKWDGAHDWGEAGMLWGGSWASQIQHPLVITEVNYGFLEATVKLESLPPLLQSELVTVKDDLLLTSSRD